MQIFALEESVIVPRLPWRQEMHKNTAEVQRLRLIREKFTTVQTFTNSPDICDVESKYQAWESYQKFQANWKGNWFKKKWVELQPPTQAWRHLTRPLRRKNTESGMAVWKFLQQFCVPRSSCRVLSSDLSRLAIRRSLTPELEGCPPRLVLYRTLSQAPAGPAAVDLGPSLSPAVRYLIGTHSITDLSAIQASGPKNRLLKG